MKIPECSITDETIRHLYFYFCARCAHNRNSMMDNCKGCFMENASNFKKGLMILNFHGEEKEDENE